MRWQSALAAALAILGIVLAGRPAAAADPDIIVFAAASLKNALDAVEADWRRQSSKHAAISYAASSALARQIDAAAPADIFISADPDWMNYVENRSLIEPQSRVNLLGNRLVLIAPKGSTVSAPLGPGFPITAVLGGGRLAIADPNAVPAGRYGKAALQSLGLWDAVKDRLAPTADVRAALRLVARGEAPLGIVYQTDAAAEPGVRVVGFFPENTHPPIVYPMALTRQARPGAAAFAAYLRGPTARREFEKQGFTVLAN
jgi:molybdate transport system substrate-binding protein